MTISVLADNVTGAVANQTAVQSNKTPFLPGRSVAGHIIQNGMTGTVPSIKIQGSDDNSSWTDLLECDQIAGGKVGMIVCQEYMRAMVATAPGTAVGRYSAWLAASD